MSKSEGPTRPPGSGRPSGGGPPYSTDPQPPTVGPVTPEVVQPPIQLRVYGEDVVLPLDPTVDMFRLGSGLDVHLHLPRRYVSRRHVTLRRIGSQLEITNLSSNGTRVAGESIIERILGAAGKFEVGETTLVILDEPMVRLRAVLARALGFAAHLDVDRALLLAMTHINAPLILTGPRGAESERIAAAIHRATARRAQPFVVVDVTGTKDAMLAAIAAAVEGTVFIDVRPLKNKRASRALLAALGEATFRARVIIGATTNDQARVALDRESAKLDEIRTPPVAARGREIPALLDAYLAEAGSPHRITELAPDRIDALRRFDWPENLDEVRRAAVRLAVYLDAERNISAAARQLGVTPQSLGEWLERIGAIARRGRGGA